MAKAKQADGGAVSSEEAAEVVSISREEYQRLLAATAPANPAPAVEEGPHLQDPVIRSAKRAQLREAGVTGDEDWLTDDMRAIVAEED